MNDSALRAALRDAASDVAAPDDLGATAWNTARRRARRTVIAFVGSAAVAVTVVVLLIGGAALRDDATPPVTKPSRTPATTVGPVDDYPAALTAVTDQRWRDADLDRLPRLPNALPASLDPFSTAAPELADDPVDRALAVAQRSSGRLDIRVLGSDQRWRSVDTSSLEASLRDGEAVSLISGSPLSPDGTRLALPQPGAVVILDLRTATSERIELQSDHAAASRPRAVEWSADGDALIVGPMAEFGHGDSLLVDVGSGAVVRAPYNAGFAAFAPDGSIVVLREGGCGFCRLDRYDRVHRVASVLLGVELYVPRPVVGAGGIAVARAVRSWSGLRSAPINADGVIVVDRDDGAPLGFLPMGSASQAEGVELIGWLDDETVAMRLGTADASGGARWALIAWNFRSGERFLLADPWALEPGFELAFAPDQL